MMASGDNMMFGRWTGLALAAMSAVVLASCQIDSRISMRAYDIKNVAETAVPVPVAATITAVFASKSWCEDEGAMAIQALGGTVPIVPVSCKSEGENATGQFNLTSNMVRTDGSQDPSTVVEEVLDGSLVRLAVFPHGKRKDLLSVGIFLDLPKLEAAKTKLVNMPVFKEGLYQGQVGLSFSVNITNDLPTMAKFYLKDVSADADQPYDESVLEVPPGGSETITLDPEKQNKLMQQGWTNFFAMAAR
jgi:hypothetical protein